MLKKLVFLSALLGVTSAFAAEYVVQISNASGSDNIYYQVGLVQESGTVDWGIETKTDEDGKSLGIATADGVAIMIFRNDADEIFYKVGDVDTEALTVDWGPKQEFAKGKSPTIDLEGNRVVCVYSGTKKDVSYVMTGWLEATRKQINWGGSFTYDDKGRNPAIGLGND